MPVVQTLVRLGMATALSMVAYLIGRIFWGVDFTDEMQHYGELISLVETGKLFQSDLFLQQALYVFLYPVFWTYRYIAGGWDFLVLVGRLLMVAAVVGTAVLAYLRFTLMGALYARWLAAGLALVCNSYNILSPNYNFAASLLVSVIAFLWLGGPRGRAYVAQTGLAVSMLCVVYPTAGAAVALLLFADEVIRRRYRLGLQVAGATFMLCAFWATVLLWFSDGPADFQDAIAFSRAFGVGRALADPRHIAFLLAVVGGGLLIVFFPRTSVEIRNGKACRLILVLSLIVVVGAVIKPSYWFIPMLYLLVLLIARGSLAVHPERRAVIGVAVAGLALGATFGLTSGNGALNIAIGLAPVLPYLGGLVLMGSMHRSGTPAGWLKRGVLMLLPWLVVSNGVLNPYREELPWKLGYALEGAPAFRGVYSSREKQSALLLLRESVGGELHFAADGRRPTLMVIGPHPWVYSALGLTAKTPMYFMHFSGGEGANQIIARRLFQGGSPDYILIASSPPVAIASALQSRLDEAYECAPLRAGSLAGDPQQAAVRLGMDSGAQLCRLIPQPSAK
jgi:hypothetical protein